MKAVTVAILAMGLAMPAAAQAQIVPAPTATPRPTSPPPVVNPGPLGADTTHLYADPARRGAIAAGGLRAPLRSLWRQDFDALVSAAVVGGGRAYVASGGRVTALDLATGRRLWTSAVPVGAGLAYGGGKVVATGNDVVALDAATGAVAWSAADESYLGGAPLIAGDVVIVQDQGLFAYDLATGRLRWQGGDSDGVDGAPAVAGDRVYQFGGCTVAATDRRTGTVLWRRNSGCSGGTSGIVAINGSLVHSSYGSVPLRASDGASTAGPKADIFSGDIGLQRGGDGIAAVNLATGRFLWSAKADDSVINDTLGAPLVIGDTLWQTRFEGTLEARAIATGAVTWRGRLRAAKETFTGSDSASDFALAGGSGVLVVLRGSTIDGLGAGAGPPTSLRITVPKPAKRLIAAGRVTVRGRVDGNLLPGAVRAQIDRHPFGRFATAGKAVAPDANGRVSIPVRTDRNARARLIGVGGSAAPTRAYVLYAYPRIRVKVLRNTGSRVTARIRVKGSRAIRYRGRRVHLYLVRGRAHRMTKLASGRLHGPRTASGAVVVGFPALKHVGRRDGVFACVPKVHRLGQGAPDRVQRRCGRAHIRF